MQYFVNQGYWEPTNAYSAGSNIRINPDYSVSFHNSLMAPGKTIMSWNSVNSYQATKLVPQLPILRNNHKYRLSVNAKAEPIYSLIIRLTFFNAQEHEIDHVEFQQRSIEFVYPPEAVQYRLELINNGLTDLTFQRFEICDAALPVSVHEDVWIHKPINEDVKGKLNLLLIADNKRVRKTYPDFKKYEDYKIQPISVAWQSSADVVAILKQWLISHRIYDANVISTNPKLDQVVLELKMELSTINAVITNQTDPHSQIADVIYPLLPAATWSSPVLVNPDWPIIFSVIQEINSKEG